MNVPFGSSLTGVAMLPLGSQRDLVDPFADKRSPWPKVIAVVILLGLAILVLNKLGLVYDWTHGRLGDPKPKPETTQPEAAVPTKAATTPTETGK